MDRQSFLKCFAFGAAAVALPLRGAAAGTGLGAGFGIGELPLSGVRRLTRERDFTVWRAGLEPAFRVAPGELVLVETSHGMPGLVTRAGEFREAPPGAKINPQTGPIYIEGVEPGEGLAVDILDIRVGDWGYSSRRIFELEGGFAGYEGGSLRLPLRPMLGCLGVAPAEGELDTRAPGDCGGNMDCREVRAGSTVVFTARVTGALVGMGDAHALQGDGEIAGQGIETDAEALVRFRRLTEPLSERPVILRPEFVATLGARPELDEAAWQATEDMVRLLARVSGREPQEAKMLVAMLGDLRVNQIVDPTKGARMELPSWVFGLGA